jgi:hypothetical protein
MTSDAYVFVGQPVSRQRAISFGVKVLVSDHDHEARRSRGVGTLVHTVFLDRCICSKAFRDVPKKDESSHVDSSRGTNKAN